jgi:hypothetical protein
LLTGYAQASQVILNLPSRNEYFSGREEYIDRISNILQEEGMVYLSGYGGVGKTQIAKEYGYLKNQDYQIIWWFDNSKSLILQYENLLFYLKNNQITREFTDLDPENIAPNALIGYVHNVLRKCNCRWLLIYDGVGSDKDLVLPVYNNVGKNIIVTSRDRRFMSKQNISLSLFSENDAISFVSKVLPNEPKNLVSKLVEKFKNYPLILAQVCTQIRLRNTNIENYIMEYNQNSANMLSDNNFSGNLAVDGYEKELNTVLNTSITSLEIDSNTALSLLYILSLLKNNLEYDMLEYIASNIGKKDDIILLQKHSLASFDDKKNIIIHDIIKEHMVANFEQEGKTKYITQLVGIFYNYYDKETNNKKEITLLSEQSVAAIRDLLNICIQNNIINDEVIKLGNIYFRINNILFYRYADYGAYQEMAERFYTIVKVNQDKIEPQNLALFYSNLIFADFYYTDAALIDEYMDKLSVSENIIKKHKGEEEDFFCYTHLAQYYLFRGELNKADIYIKKAGTLLGQAVNELDKIQYWYTALWISYEYMDYVRGFNNLENFMKGLDQYSSSKIAILFGRNIEAKMYLLKGDSGIALKITKKGIKEANSYFNGLPSSVLGEYTYTLANIYFQDKKFNLAEIEVQNGLRILKQVYKEDFVDLTQAALHIMQGEIYEHDGKDIQALNEYKLVESYYSKVSKIDHYELYEQGRLLKNLARLYYVLGDKAQSKKYLKKLAADYKQEFKLVEELMNELPKEYIYEMANET